MYIAPHMYEEVHRAVPETVTIGDIVGIDLSYTGCFFRDWGFDDEDISRCVYLKAGRYVSRRRCSGNTASKDLNTDEVDAIRGIIEDSGILDARIDERLMIYDAGDDYITL